MNSDQRRAVRESLREQGFHRVQHTYDNGNGMYTENWANDNSDEVRISWGMRT
jgi:hypothetical protein